MNNMLERYKQQKQTADKLHRNQFDAFQECVDPKKTDIDWKAQPQYVPKKPELTTKTAKFERRADEVDYNTISKPAGSLRVDDIKGAQPKVKSSGHWYKPVEPVPGASPKKLHGRYNVPNLRLDVEDIKGAQADQIKFNTDRRTIA